MVKRNILFGLFLLFQSVVSAQKDIREKVILITDTETYLTGEVIRFSSFVISDLTSKSTSLSSVLYVELLDQENNPHFQTKIKLENGRGYGEFFLPTTLPTGIYSIVGYTRWMKNFDDFFQKEIAIINPFERNNSPKSTGEPSIKLWPEGGNLTIGSPTKVVYQKVKGSDTNSFNARIVDSEGQVVVNLDQEDTGVFLFTAAPDMDYQIIIEKPSGEFVFQPFLKANEAPGLIVKIKEDRVQVHVSGNQSSDWRGEVAIYNSNKVFTKSEVFIGDQINQQISVQGLVNVLLTKDGEEVAERVVYMGTLEPEKTANELGKYGIREKLSIDLALPKGSYTIATRLAYDFDFISGTNINKDLLLEDLARPIFSTLDLNDALIANNFRHNIPTNGGFTHLPEYRGELLSGSFLDSLGKPLSNRGVTFSIPGDFLQIKAAQTDGNGDFTINFDTPPKKSAGYLQILDYPGTPVLEIEEKFHSPQIKRESTIRLDSLTAEKIAQRSIHNQLENVYFQQKEDSTIEVPTWLTPFDDFHGVYVFDDYNRFPTLEDHFSEYILKARVRKRSGRKEFIVLPDYVRFEDSRDPLILFDGVPISAENALSFNPYKVYSVGILNKRFYLGPMILDGIIDIRTFHGALDDLKLDQNTIKIDMPNYQLAKKIYEPAYSKQPSKLPDYRELLFWDPIRSVSKDESTDLEFYTSDVKGDYIIKIDGITNDGETYTLRKVFTVN